MFSTLIILIQLYDVLISDEIITLTNNKKATFSSR